MFLKLDSLLHNITSAGKLLFQVTGAVKMGVWQTQYLFSRDSQQWTCSRTCLASGGVSDKIFFQVGWNTGRENLSHHPWIFFCTAHPCAQRMSTETLKTTPHMRH